MVAGSPGKSPSRRAIRTKRQIGVGKAEIIQQVLAEPCVDLWKLRELALSEGGLVNDELRKRAWPKLLGLVTLVETSPPESSTISPSKDPNDAFLSVEKTFPQPTTASPIRPTHNEDHQSVHSASDNDSHAAVNDWGDSSFVDVSKNLPAVAEGSSRMTSPTNCGQPLSEFFRNIASKSQVHRLARDDISISSATTASLGNMTAGTNGTRRYSLPILANSLDFRQIELDVARCTWHLLTGDQRIQRLQMEHKRNRKVARLIRRKQRRLANLINYTLVQSYPLTSPHKMRYYQGFHDVACIFMSVLGGGTTQQNFARGGIPQDQHELAVAMGLELSSQVLVQVSQSHLSDFLKSDFSELQTAIELTIFPLIAKLDPDLHACLASTGMQPFFALSWILTWFSHEVRETSLVKRLFDLFLVSHPLMPIYLSVAMVLHPTNRRIILSSDQDFGSLHQTLRNLTKNSSMTGWKYRPGDGYVSDTELEEEEDAEDESMSVLEQAGIDGDIVKIKSELRDDHATTSSAGSICGDSVSEGHARVPFQELIDLALEIMNRVPPRRLLPLAVRCYGGPHVGALLARSPNIRLFADPQPWAVRSLATADWVFQQRARKEKEHRSNRETPRNTQQHSLIDDIEDPQPLQKVLLERRNSPAVIALGFGEGDAAMRRKRRRNRMIVLAIGVGILAVAIGISMSAKSRPSQSEYNDNEAYSSEGTASSCGVGDTRDCWSSVNSFYRLPSRTDFTNYQTTSAASKEGTASMSAPMDQGNPDLSTGQSPMSENMWPKVVSGQMKADPKKILGNCIDAAKKLPALAKNLAGKLQMKITEQRDL